MTIIPYADQYTRVKYGSYMVGQRTYKDVPVLIEAPDIVFNDTETIIYGASRVKSLGICRGCTPVRSTYPRLPASLSC